MITPSNGMSASNCTKFFEGVDPDKALEIGDGLAVSTLGVLVVDVKEPLGLRGHVGQLVELRITSNDNAVVFGV